MVYKGVHSKKTRIFFIEWCARVRALMCSALYYLDQNSGFRKDIAPGLSGLNCPGEISDYPGDADN